MLETLGFQPVLWAMAGLLALVLAGRADAAAADDGQRKASKSARELFAKNAGHQHPGGGAGGAVRRAGRVVRGRGAGVPCIRQGLDLHDGRHLPGPWTIGYGLVQAWRRLVKRSNDGLSARCRRAGGRRCWPWSGRAGGCGGLDAPRPNGSWWPGFGLLASPLR